MLKRVKTRPKVTFRLYVHSFLQTYGNFLLFSVHQPLPVSYFREAGILDTFSCTLKTKARGEISSAQNRNKGHWFRKLARCTLTNQKDLKKENPPHVLNY